MPHGVPAEAAFERDYPKPGFNPSWKNPQINRMLDPGLRHLRPHGPADGEEAPGEGADAHQRVDGLGRGRLGERARRCIAHGRHDIVEFLLEKGARIDIFCAAMMGQLEAVRAFLTLQPKLIDSRAARVHAALPRPARQGFGENAGLPPVGEENRTQAEPVPQEAADKNDPPKKPE